MRIQAIIGAACALGAAIPDVSVSQSGRLTISIPRSGEIVKEHNFVRGKAPAGVRQVWLIVHPLEVQQCWIQGPTIINSDSSWELMGQFGEVGAEHSGKPYEIRALSKPHVAEALRPGPVDCGIDADYYSDPVDVIRE